jgi:hypothetical protein
MSERAAASFFITRRAVAEAFIALMRLYANSGIGMVGMTNATGFNVRRLQDTLDDAFLGAESARP